MRTCHLQLCVTFVICTCLASCGGTSPGGGAAGNGQSGRGGAAGTMGAGGAPAGNSGNAATGGTFAGGAGGSGATGTAGSGGSTSGSGGGGGSGGKAGGAGSGGTAGPHRRCVRHSWNHRPGGRFFHRRHRRNVGRRWDDDLHAATGRRRRRREHDVHSTHAAFGQRFCHARYGRRPGRADLRRLRFHLRHLRGWHAAAHAPAERHQSARVPRRARSHWRLRTGRLGYPLEGDQGVLREGEGAGSADADPGQRRLPVFLPDSRRRRRLDDVHGLHEPAHREREGQWHDRSRRAVGALERGRLQRLLERNPGSVAGHLETRVPAGSRRDPRRHHRGAELRDGRWRFVDERLPRLRQDQQRHAGLHLLARSGRGGRSE